MSRKKKSKITLNSIENLETIMQEVYTDANVQINDANRAINELSNSTTPEDVSDYTMIAKEKGNLLKIKDSATKIKLDLAKLEAEILKNQVEPEEVAKVFSAPSKADFKSIRELIEKKNNPEPEEYNISDH